MPQENMGLFITNNYGNHSQENRVIQLFAADVILGDTPWFNSSDVCSWLGPVQYNEDEDGDLDIRQLRKPYSAQPLINKNENASTKREDDSNASKSPSSQHGRWTIHTGRYSD